MAPFHSLIEKYQTYKRDFNLLRDENALDENIKIIGEAAKFLSLFGLQWFCDEEPFFPVPSFNRPPSRALLLEGKSLLIGNSLQEFLSNLEWRLIYKGREGAGCVYVGRFINMNGTVFVPMSLALGSLCQVSLGRLDNVISQLEEKSTATNENSNS